MKPGSKKKQYEILIPGQELDQLVFKITKDIWSRIDCTQCGRCCMTLQPMLTDEDHKRLADKLQITIDELRKQYVEYDNSDPDEPDWKMKSTPCPFLKDNKCSVYEARPGNCRDYPYLYGPDFSFRTMGMIGRTFTCPIVFEVFEELKEQLDFLKTSWMI
jgi:hypothetical protein